MSRKKRKTTGTAKPVQTADAFSNPLFHLGYGSQSPLEATEYPLTRMTYDYALLNSLYRSNWVVQNVVGIIPDDMLREGFTVSGAISPKYQQELDRCLRQTQLYDRINEGMRWGRLYGGAAGLILIRGQEDLSKPLELDTILPGTFAGLYIVDRWSGITPGMELVSDLAAPDFGLPKYYDINMADGRTVVSVHHSRIIRFVGRELPYLEKMAEMYWGESEVEALYADVVKHDNVAANMAALTFRANVDFMEVENLDQLFSVAPTAIQQRFWNMMQAQNVLKSNFGMQLVNKGDSVKNTQYTFTGLQEIYDSMCLDLSGASRIPVTKLFGRAPAGLNATGESDLQNYYDYVDTLRESKLRPILEKLLPIIAMSVWGGVPEDMDIQFPPLWTPTAKEVAEIAKYKAETLIAVFQAGLMDQATAQKELKKLSDETGLFESITDDEIKANKGRTFQDVTALRDPLMGLNFEEEETLQNDVMTIDYRPDQPRDKLGRWTSGGAVTLSGDRFQTGDEVNTHFGGKGGLLAKKKSAEGKWVSSLSQAEEKTVSEYTADLYADVNNYLRGHGEKLGNARQEYVDNSIKNLDSALQKFDNPSDFVTYRAIKPEAFSGVDLNSLVGKEYTDKAYMSTSPLLNSSAVNKNLLMEIKVPGGQNRGAYINKLAGQYKDKEYEYLLPRNSKFKIVGVTEINGKPALQMEMI